MKESFCVCYFGTYRAEYSRNQIMIAALRSNGIQVIECHEPLWHSIEDRVQTASGGWCNPNFLIRVIRTYYNLLKKYHKISDYDVMILGYPGQFDVYLARLLAWLRHKPLALDAFMSPYLIALERGLTNQHRWTARLIYGLEWLAYRLSDLLIADTYEYVAWYRRTFGLSLTRFALIPTGADDRIFRPMDIPHADVESMHVVYYGTFIPNHGVIYILEAARLLNEQGATIHIELIGDGPDRNKALAFAKRYNLTNVTFIGWLDQTDLIKHIARADVCLGAFGNTPQSLMTIQNKIYEGLAMAKPVLTGDSPAIHKSLQHRTHVYLVERANPETLPKAIAEGLLQLQIDPALRQRLGEQGYLVFTEKYAIKIQGEQLCTHLRGIL